MTTSEARRHRHPDYASGRRADRCGGQIIVLHQEDGTIAFQFGGQRRRKCPHCGTRLRAQDLR